MTSNIEEGRLSQRDVERLLSTGVSAAQGRGVAVSIALVDAGGHLLGFLRMDGVHTATCDVAVAKARSSAAFRRPIRLFAEQLAAGNLSLLTIPGCVPLQGGIPFKLGETMIGAVGVSGASPDIDEAIALAIANDRSSNDLTSVS